MARAIPALFAAFLVASAPAQAASEVSVKRSLSAAMRAAGAYSGAHVVDASSGRTLFSWRAGTPRVLASNVKLFTTAAALGELGEDGRIETTVVADGEVTETGIFRGDLFLRGAGDPTFGNRSYVRRRFGAGAATVEDLAVQVADSGIAGVRGGVRGDETLFDRLRGGPDSGFGVSPWVGPLSALAFNHGYVNGRFQSDPAKLAADRLRAALRAEGVNPGRLRSPAAAPPEGRVVARVESPRMATIARLTNKDSDNWFAETLLKALGRQVAHAGTTAAGARVAMSFAAGLGARPRLVDGSGLSRSNRASPRHVASLLLRERGRPEYDAFYASLPVAGVDGTLHDRMERGPARRRCRGKTGSLIGVSALSGYCTSAAGREVVFSILMNGVSVSYARRLQDRMAQALAGLS